MEFSKKKKFPIKTLKNILVVLVIFSAGFLFGQSDFAKQNLYFRSKNKSDSNLPNNLDYSGVEEVYSKLKDSFDGELTQQKLQDGLKEGLVRAAGDPYTEFLNAEATKEFEEGLSGSFEGIGAELGKDKESIVIISPISGFPAEKAGIKAKDIIVEIDGESAADLSVTEAVKKIRGQKGTKVKLTVFREGKTLEFEITRDQITIPSVTTEVTDSGIGIIKISRFGDDTVQLATDAAANLKSKNVKGIILDLRGNPGGLLEGAVGISEIWLSNGDKILQEKRGEEVIKTYFADGKQILGGVKTVILIDEGSASASEIVAGALKDNNAATIIGTKSYGKGSVQEVKSLSFGGTLKVTVARWFTPNGRNIDKEGIEPDQKVEISEEDAKANRDPQKDAAIQFIQKAQ
ncbi:S41 family peptidase [Candidatus Saccharibacteria bacterium]|nr:S41 family peptidase [Candidatus Saccharibacteria bacterium]